MNPLRSFLLLAAFAVSASAATFNIVGPPGSGTFGRTVTALPNGNFVVTDPDFDQVSPAVANIGAVYLYSPDGALISILKGSKATDQVGNLGVVVLANGNFVVRSSIWDNGSITDAGAATWGSSVFGFIGGASVVVSVANSLVGGSNGDFVSSEGVTVLPNGHYVVRSPNWNNTSPAAGSAGAVTWGNGFSGKTGVVSGSNSLVGGSASNEVGRGSITILPNGHYVVCTPTWDQPSPAVTNVGAVTWALGNTAITGLISATNSLIGSTLEDRVGSNGAVALVNGHYVVSSPLWANGAFTDAGAATWGDGNVGTAGTVSPANSLVGTSFNDQVSGSGVVPLNNGNYVVRSQAWANTSPVIGPVGAVTWGNGTTGISGPITAANSLIGTTQNEFVGSGGVVALTNGNYVIATPLWDKPSPVTTDVGAVTWANGKTGIVGTISAANSLVGSTASDRVGQTLNALTNGNFVVGSSFWNLPSPAVASVGAATWGNGTTGIKGLVSAANSLIGSTAGDFVGGFLIPLTNGNYVVASSSWDTPTPLTNNVGAVTWASGTTGIKGIVSAANSLVGTTAEDRVGNFVNALTNGNYVVSSSSWDSASPATNDVGAVTWGNGSTGIKGSVSAANSLVGTTAFDLVGNAGVLVLNNGNYVTSTAFWTNPTTGAANSGAVTWGNGSTGITGPVSAANSLTGAATLDNVGNGGANSFAQNDSSYLVQAVSFDNPSPPTTDSGAISLGNGDTGTVGQVSSRNSVIGTASGSNLVFAYDPVFKQLIVGRRDSNLVTVFSNRLRSLAKTNLPAPGAADIAFSTAGTTAVNSTGGTLSDFTLTGAGSTAGRNRALFSTLSASRTLDLDLQTGDSVSTLSVTLPSNAKVSAIGAPITQQPNLGVFQTTVSGTGLTTGNNVLLLLDNGIQLQPLLRLGQPIGALGNVSPSKFLQVLQNHTADRLTIAYQLKAGTTPLVNASNDSGLMQLDHSGAVLTNVREGNTIFDPMTFTLIGTFGQFTGQVASSTNVRQHFIATFKRAAIPVFVPAVLSVETGFFAITADQGLNAFGAVLPGDAPARFATFTGVSQLGNQALFKATLTGCPTATNEGLFLGNGTRLLRKGDDVDAINLPGVKFGTLQRYWPAGSTQVIVQTTLTGTGVTTANNQALLLRQSDNTFIVLLRTGTAAPGCGPAKLLTLSAVDVNPVSGRYVALGTLSGAVATNNQALWTGDTTLGNTTTLKLLRTPALRLRKGQTYSTPATPLGLVKGLTLKPAVDATGAGGRGLAQCIGSGGDVAVYVLGDRSVTELVMLPP